MKMNLKKKIVVILIVSIFFGIVLVYNSPEENSKYKNDLHGIINAASRFSWLLFVGDKKLLLSEFDFTDYAKSKLMKANIHYVLAIDILNKYKAGGGKYEKKLKSVLFKEPEDIELVALESQRHYLAMTYTLNDGPNIPDKGEMLYSIVFRYYQPVKKSLWEKILRKTANTVPFCSSLGTTGRWLVVDYSYTYNQSDYVTWYLREGDIVSSQSQEDNWARINKLRTKEGIQEFKREIELDMTVLEEWASAWVERHPNHIDVQLFETANKIRKETGTTPK
jgi:hypothetical protein